MTKAQEARLVAAIQQAVDAFIVTQDSLAVARTRFVAAVLAAVRTILEVPGGGTADR